MSDLISRADLLKAFKVHGFQVVDEWRVIKHLIANAPAFECKTSLQQGEPVAWALFYDNGIVHHVTKYVPPTMNGSHLGYKPLYTTPPQPQTVKDALEKAASICEEQGNTWDSDSQITHLNYAEHCAWLIRALI